MDVCVCAPLRDAERERRKIEMSPLRFDFHSMFSYWWFSKFNVIQIHQTNGNSNINMEWLAHSTIWHLHKRKRRKCDGIEIEIKFIHMKTSTCSTNETWASIYSTFSLSLSFVWTIKHFFFRWYAMLAWPKYDKFSNVFSILGRCKLEKRKIHGPFILIATVLM